MMSVKQQNSIVFFGAVTAFICLFIFFGQPISAQVNEISSPEEPYVDFVAPEETPVAQEVRQNEQPVENVLENILKIRGVRYQVETTDFDPVSGASISKLVTHYGSVLNDVDVAFPALIQTGPNNEKNINYQQFIPILIEAIRLQQTEINELKSKISKSN